jgi:hypothetical protein
MLDASRSRLSLYENLVQTVYTLCQSTWYLSLLSYARYLLWFYSTRVSSSSMSGDFKTIQFIVLVPILLVGATSLREKLLSSGPACLMTALKARLP